MQAYEWNCDPITLPPIGHLFLFNGILYEVAPCNCGCPYPIARNYWTGNEDEILTLLIRPNAGNPENKCLRDYCVHIAKDFTSNQSNRIHLAYRLLTAGRLALFN